MVVPTLALTLTEPQPRFTFFATARTFSDSFFGTVMKYQDASPGYSHSFAVNENLIRGVYHGASYEETVIGVSLKEAFNLESFCATLSLCIQ